MANLLRSEPISSALASRGYIVDPGMEVASTTPYLRSAQNTIAAFNVWSATGDRFAKPDTFESYIYSSINENAQPPASYGALLESLQILKPKSLDSKKASMLGIYQYNRGDWYSAAKTFQQIDRFKIPRIYRDGIESVFPGLQERSTSRDTEIPYQQFKPAPDSFQKFMAPNLITPVQ